MTLCFFNNFLKLAVSFALLLAAASAGAQNSEVNAPPWQRIELGAQGQRYPFAIYSNRPWSGDMRSVKSAVLIFHGMGRNAHGYYAAAEKLLRASGTKAGETLLIAPHYFATTDAAALQIDGMPQWRGGRWNRGDDAANWPWPLSSFQPIDDLLAALLDPARFPRLESIVVAGHSAGGQLVHRYAVLNAIDEKVRTAGRRLSYVIANPSSYLYFTNERPKGTGFAVYDVAACPGYNQYRYGMENLLRYARNLDVAMLFKRYAAREVAYLLGTADNDPNHAQLDKDCGAQAGGSQRLERGRNYIRYERYLASSNVKLNRRAFEVIDVGHSQAPMLGSKCGAALVFGMGEEKNIGGAACRVPPL